MLYELPRLRHAAVCLLAGALLRAKRAVSVLTEGQAGVRSQQCISSRHERQTLIKGRVGDSVASASTTVGQQYRTVLSSLPAPVSRRAFLSGAAAVAISGRVLSRKAYAELHAPAFLHLAACSAGKGSVHTYAVTDDRCELLGNTTIDSFAAYASHPTLPVLYVARACSQWQYLPRGVIETYRVERSTRPLQLLAQTPMALSATGPRSLSISSCGRYLLLSASTGRAWNAFVLGSDGIPASVAIARKETGSVLESQAISVPAPHAVAFSPRGLHAVGTDPGSELMTV